MTAIRLLIDPPADGAWNMAVDEALLQSTAASGVTTLRFYQWTPATLSLGYFQTYAERATHPASLACPVVRRSTGGGAIVHDNELTYSLATPVSSRFGVEAAALYDVVHQSLVATLHGFGISAAMHPKALAGAPKSAEPFLCFQRRAGGDVIVAGHKIAGSAQRRHRGTVLQHGSVLLRQSVAAPELPGLTELGLNGISQSDLQASWLDRLAIALKISANLASLSSLEQQLAQQLQSSPHQSQSWLKRR